jgi:hypothetical protein
VSRRGHGPWSLVGVIAGLAVQAVPFTNPWSASSGLLVFAAVPAIGLGLFLAPGRTGQFGIGLMASGIAYWFGLFGSLSVFFPVLWIPIVLLVTIGLLLYAVPVLACDACRALRPSPERSPR